jgi:hypothetical protein
MADEWPKMTLREANVTLIDCDHRTPPAADNGYPYIAIPQLRSGRIDLSDVRRITREHYREWTRKAKPAANDVILSRRCNPGDTAVAARDLEFALGQNLVLLRADGTKVYPRLENGKTAYVGFLEAGQVGWGSTEYIVLHPKPPLPAEFAYCLARGSEFREFAIQSMTGSSGRQRVPAESLSHFRVVAAPRPIAELFGRLIKPLFARAKAATNESRSLAALRDTLLPKLISGELRVKDADRFIEKQL